MQHYPPRGRVRLNIEHLPSLLHAAYQRRVYEAEEYLLSMWGAEVSKCTGQGQCSNHFRTSVGNLVNFATQKIRFTFYGDLSAWKKQNLCVSEFVSFAAFSLSIVLFVNKLYIAAFRGQNTFFTLMGYFEELKLPPVPCDHDHPDMWESSNAR